HLSVVSPPGSTVEGWATIETDGGAGRVTSTDACACPPRPKHRSPNFARWPANGTEVLPRSARRPFQLPNASHRSAPSAVHESVDVSPATTLPGSARSEIAGAG